MRTHPQPPRDDLRLSNTAAVLQNMQICMICILSGSHYVIALSKAFFFVFAVKICLRHQSVTSLLCGSPPPKRNPGSAPVQQTEAFLAVHAHVQFSTEPNQISFL